MKQICIVGAGLLLAGTLAARGDAFDGISVVVNDSVITYGQVLDGIAPLYQAFAMVHQNEPQLLRSKEQELERDQVEGLIENKLILDDFSKGGYATNVLESAIDDVVKDDIKKNYGGSRSKLMLSLQEEGITYETYRKHQRERFIIGYMVNHNTGNRKILVSPLKIENYYREHPDDFKVDDEVKLRMIALAPGTQREVANEIVRKIDAGVPFAEMAAVYDADRYRDKGGDRDWVTRKIYTKELADVMFSLKPGQHSPVVALRNPETGNSTFYLLKVDETRPAHISPLSEVHAQIEQKLKDIEAKRLQHDWIEHLKSKSHIEYYRVLPING